MEVAAGDNGFVFREDQRVVCNSIDLDVHFVDDELQCVADSAVDLRDAAERIRVLDTVLLAVVEDLRAFQQHAHIVCNEDLAFVSSGCMDTGIERIAETGQAFKGHRRDDIRHFRCADGVVQRQGAAGGHRAGAVGHAEAFFADQRIDGLDAGAFHCLRTGKNFALILGFAKAQDGECHVCQRSEVTGGSQRSFFRNHRQNVLVEHLDHDLCEQGTDTGETDQQVVDTQQQDAADDLVRIRFAAGGAVAENQVRGELVGHLFRNSNLLEVTKTGRNAIGRLAGLLDSLRQFSGLLHALQRCRIDLDRCMEAARRDEFLKDQTAAVEGDFFNIGRIVLHS